MYCNVYCVNLNSTIVYKKQFEAETENGDEQWTCLVNHILWPVYMYWQIKLNN